MNFELDSKQVDAFAKWDAEHLKEAHGGKHPYCGAIGGRLTFYFTSTSIGQIAKVACGLCNAVHDLTDYDSW